MHLLHEQNSPMRRSCALTTEATSIVDACQREASTRVFGNHRRCLSLICISFKVLQCPYDEK